MTAHNKLDQALEALHAEQQDANAPAEVVQQTIAALYEQAEIPVSSQVEQTSHPSRWRWAAAAILLLMLGFTTGQLSTRNHVNQQLAQWQLHMESQLTDRLLQTQQAQLVQVADQFNQGLNQRFYELASGTMAMSQASQEQLLNAVLQAFDQKQSEQRQEFIQLLGHMENQQLMQNAVLAEGLVTVADVTQSLLSPEQQTKPTRFLQSDPNSLQH